jgi:hypothetical protein
MGIRSQSPDVSPVGGNFPGVRILNVPMPLNCIVRLYRPRAEILNGKWVFPRRSPCSELATNMDPPGSGAGTVKPTSGLGHVSFKEISRSRARARACARKAVKFAPQSKPSAFATGEPY